MELPVERADGPGVGVVHVLVGHPPTPQDVVDGDEPALAKQLQAQLVVAVVVLLVRVDEGKVIGPRSSPAEQGL